MAQLKIAFAAQMLAIALFAQRRYQNCIAIADNELPLGFANVDGTLHRWIPDGLHDDREHLWIFCPLTHMPNQNLQLGLINLDGLGSGNGVGLALVPEKNAGALAGFLHFILQSRKTRFAVIPIRYGLTGLGIAR